MRVQHKDRAEDCVGDGVGKDERQDEAGDSGGGDEALGLPHPAVVVARGARSRGRRCQLAAEDGGRDEGGREERGGGGRHEVPLGEYEAVSVGRGPSNGSPGDG